MFASTRFSTLRALLAISICLPPGAAAQAQWGVWPSHGKKVKLDSYNYLLRDVHPASQAQANYLQNRLFLVGLKKAERLERQERLDVYAERQFIKTLRNYGHMTKRLSAGRSTAASNLDSFWALVSVFGDRAEVYDALASEVPPISHEAFVPTSFYIQIMQPNGSLQDPPHLLESCEDLDASKLQSAWTTLARSLRSSGQLSAREVTDFRNCVAAYREHGTAAIQSSSLSSDRVPASDYLWSLRALADALRRPQQTAQIQHYLEQSNSYSGGTMLDLLQHMLRHNLTPAQGSTAQIALAEVARPINRVLEQEIALHYERIDSLAAGEGHRPYAAEYRQHEAPIHAAPGPKVTQAAPDENPGT
jgi:hypothetical protein